MQSDEQIVAAVPLQSFNPTAMSRVEGRPVVRSPDQLQLHPALDELDWTDVVSELNEARRSWQQFLSEPILITTNRTILAGFGRWRLAVLEGVREIECIEYPLSNDEALPFILTHHRTRRGWNAFVRIRLALTLEPYFQQKALTNMREGGKRKGLANLPEAYRIDVRQEIAKVAGVGGRGRNVSNVKKILQTAHPRLMCALQDGTLTINRALQFCKLPQFQQLAEFIRYSEDRATMKVVGQSLRRFKKLNNLPDPMAALEAVQNMEAVQPGSVMILAGRLPRTVVLIGQDLLTSPQSQRELKLR